MNRKKLGAGVAGGSERSEVLSTISCIGLDGHKNFSRFTVRDSDGRVLTRGRLEHADRAAMNQVLSAYPPGTPVVLESSFGWSWLSDTLAGAGLAPHLANCRHVEALRKSRNLAKTNRLDADLLSELWAMQPHWWEVYLAPQEVRDQRELMRHRMGLVQNQTRIKNRIHAILHRHGILHEFSDLFGRDGRLFLKSLLAPEDQRLRMAARMTLEEDLELLEMMRVKIARNTRYLHRAVRADPAAEIWRSLPGIGWVLAYTIQAEIGPIGRFKNAKHLASYSLLAPKARESGDEDKHGVPQGRHLGKAGRTTLKWAFLEAARSAVRKSPRMRRLFDHHTDQGTRDKNRGYVAVAHQLCLIGYACQKHQRRYQENPPGQPGSGGGES